MGCIVGYGLVCVVLRCVVAWCGVALCDAVWRGSMSFELARYVAACRRAWRCVVLRCIMVCCGTARRGTALCCCAAWRVASRRAAPCRVVTFRDL